LFDLKSKHSAGFSEFEFLGLIAAGLVIAALLAHFVFDQSIQVEKLHALVARDEVRLKLETRLADLDILKKSAQAIADDSDLLPLKACILGREGNQACKNKSTCCESRLKKSIPILDFGDERQVLGGTTSEPACLSKVGEAVAKGSKDCFAESSVSLETICADGASTCDQASALLIKYQLLFTPEFLKSSPELATLERTLSLVIEPSSEPKPKSQHR